MTDQQFVHFAGQTDMVEVNLGQLAQDVAASPEVKDYGKMLTTDHTAVITSSFKMPRNRPT
jgi:putative membrane protein